MKISDCCVAMDFKPEPTKYTHERDWSLEGNRPVVRRPDEGKYQPPTTNKPAETGLIVRQPL